MDGHCIGQEQRLVTFHLSCDKAQPHKAKPLDTQIAPGEVITGGESHTVATSASGPPTFQMMVYRSKPLT